MYSQDDCGSGDVTNENDDIVFCDTCHLGHHQSCYDIYPKPGLKDPWNCKACEAAKQAHASVSRKRKPSSAHKALSKRKDERKNQEDSYSDADSSEIIPDNNEGLKVEVWIRHKAPNLAIPQNGRHAVSQPVPELAESSASAGNNVREEDRSSDRSITPPEESTLEESTPEGCMPKESLPEPHLSHEQIKGTILLTRLKNEEIFRKVLLANARTVDALFKECTHRWHPRFSDSIARLLYIDDENHFVEIVKGHSADYIEFLRMIRTRWNNEGGEVVRVKLILLAAGETEGV
ncbi:hypothetical protein L207DRAFT_343905 [Hyaloscypha variabilis F]|uniref:PHD-type domain-containing protein n=1 Tax=Hyaloscypha variabilis (strain UAMH 11265 / GT02V1 / F) TaxID=1149755 RepID=A0A2J6RQB8_HYAVF|nr:hypothetical protein L207DRAFT_343905 [Hyaloscypha variabilis F]